MVQSLFMFQLCLTTDGTIFVYVSVVPNHCWYEGTRYECGLSLSCVFAGAKVGTFSNKIYSL